MFLLCNHYNAQKLYIPEFNFRLRNGYPTCNRASTSPLLLLYTTQMETRSQLGQITCPSKSYSVSVGYLQSFANVGRNRSVLQLLKIETQGGFKNIYFFYYLVS